METSRMKMSYPMFCRINFTGSKQSLCCEIKRKAASCLSFTKHKFLLFHNLPHILRRLKFDTRKCCWFPSKLITLWWIIFTSSFHIIYMRYSKWNFRQKDNSHALYRTFSSNLKILSDCLTNAILETSRGEKKSFQTFSFLDKKEQGRKLLTLNVNRNHLSQLKFYSAKVFNWLSHPEKQKKFQLKKSSDVYITETWQLNVKSEWQFVVYVRHICLKSKVFNQINKWQRSLCSESLLDGMFC